MENFNIEKIFNSYPEVYSIDNKNVFVTKSPLANCQTFALGGIEYLLSKDNAEEQLLKIREIVKKKQILVDISEGWMGKLEKIFIPEQFLVKSSYKNSTGNPMVLCLIKMI